MRYLSKLILFVVLIPVFAQAQESRTFSVDNSVRISWKQPTQRTDGSAFDFELMVDRYEIYFQNVQQPTWPDTAHIVAAPAAGDTAHVDWKIDLPVGSYRVVARAVDLNGLVGPKGTPWWLHIVPKQMELAPPDKSEITGLERL